jgi:predicted metalloprotease
MRWRGERQSTNIEDRRGLSGGKIAIGGGLGSIVILIHNSFSNRFQMILNLRSRPHVRGVLKRKS